MVDLSPRLGLTVLSRVSSLEEFVAAAATGATMLPVVGERLGDLLTPVSAALRLFPQWRRPFLLESAEGGENIGRYSYLGGDPFLEVTGGREGLALQHRDGTLERLDGDPVAHLGALHARFRAVPAVGAPPFTGGGVGYVGYDAVRWVERLGDGTCAVDVPWVSMAFYDVVLAFDHLKHRIVLVANAQVDGLAREPDLQRAYEAAVARIETLAAALREAAAAPVPLESVAPEAASPLRVRCGVDHDRFCQWVRRVQDHIVAGDVFQVVLSRRLECDTVADPVTVYRALRAINPSPYMFCFQAGDAWVVGSSPEMLVRIEGDRVEARPIAGTRRRDTDPAVDAALEAELLADDKERAEHLMLVDLGRNDVGRIAEYGSVEVPEFMRVERYSHVMHIVSAVQGRLRARVSPVQALFACFPAGTVSGAPKIRAMQIIDELEPGPRGVYAGAVLYSDFAGNLNSCIAIRTLVLRDGCAAVQAGAGIVADSVPEREFAETEEKASAPLRALAWADSAARNTGSEGGSGERGR